jgi:hypothetical protein
VQELVVTRELSKQFLQRTAVLSSSTVIIAVHWQSHVMYNRHNSSVRLCRLLYQAIASHTRCKRRSVNVSTASLLYKVSNKQHMILWHYTECNSQHCNCLYLFNAQQVQRQHHSNSVNDAARIGTVSCICNVCWCVRRAAWLQYHSSSIISKYSCSCNHRSLQCSSNAAAITSGAPRVPVYSTNFMKVHVLQRCAVSLCFCAYKRTVYRHKS